MQEPVIKNGIAKSGDYSLCFVNCAAAKVLVDRRATMADHGQWGKIYEFGLPAAGAFLDDAQFLELTKQDLALAGTRHKTDPVLGQFVPKRPIQRATRCPTTTQFPSIRTVPIASICCQPPVETANWRALGWRQ